MVRKRRRSKSKLRPYLIGLSIALAVAIVATVTAWYLSTIDISVLNPKGQVGQDQRDLFVFTVILGAVVVIPVFLMTIFIAWRYREGNTKAKYTPDDDTNHLAETIWWGIPIVLIAILAVVTWNSTFKLDPYEHLTDEPPMAVKVISLDWKWLFIYPEQDIATVNFVQFPVDRPVEFEITSDTVMNSFWIPSLGGQIYAMPGMPTKLNLVANKVGNYNGQSANISGEGFAGMKFIAKASSKQDFQTWLDLVKQSSHNLTPKAYTELSKPTKDHPPTYYASVEPNLFQTIVAKYMHHAHMPPEGAATEPSPHTHDKPDPSPEKDRVDTLDINNNNRFDGQPDKHLEVDRP